jgi:hypothetical protein
VFDDFNLDDILSQPFISDEDLAGLNFDPAMWSGMDPIMDQSGMFNIFDPTYQVSDILSSFDPAMLEQIAGLGGGGLTSTIARALGLGGGGSGGMGGLERLLPLLLGVGGTVAGGINQREATQEAQARMDKAIAEANDTVKGLLGGVGDAYKPYQDAGAGGLAKLAGMTSNLSAGVQPIGQASSMAGRYGPIGQASNLAAGRSPVGQASDIASKFKPIGYGRGIK